MSAGFAFDGRIYKVMPDINLICEIESELGGIAQLLENFTDGSWRVSDLVTMTHMMLAAAGREIDYRTLGNKMISEGLESYRHTACRFLGSVMQKRQEQRRQVQVVE